MLTADSGRKEERGREEMERGRGGVKAEYIMGRNSSGGRREGKCPTVDECGRGPVVGSRRKIGISHLFPPFSPFYFKQFPSTRAQHPLSFFTSTMQISALIADVYLSVPRRKKVPDATAAATFLQFI